MWDFNIEEEEATFRDDLREASGVGRKKNKKRRRREGPVLSQQVRALIGEGNQAYVDGDVPETIRIMQEVIRIEPRASSAWSVLAQCYEDMKEPQKALQLRIMAAHLMHDAELWDRLARESRDLGYNQQALYCYRKVFSLDPTNVAALWERAFLAKEIGDLRTTRNSLLAVLKRIPNDLNVLSELRPILIELSDLSTCATLFQSAFDHYQSAYPIPSPDAPTPFGLMEVLVLADLYNTTTLARYEQAVEVIRKGCRWLQGRLEQKVWDYVEDDREYDVPEMEREREGDVSPGMYPLDVNARHRLAVARIKMGDFEEGRMHANIVLAQDVLDYAPLFGEIADAYFERKVYEEARPIYELLGADAGTSSLYVLLQAAACRRMLGELREAAEVYEHVIQADPTHNDAKMKLAEIYEILNEPRKALDLVYQVIDSRRKRAAPKGADGEPTSAAAPGTSLFEEKARTKSKSSSSKSQNRLTPAQLKELEKQKELEVTDGYHRLKALWPRMMVGDEAAEREWLFEAEKLVETFRETRKLFITNRTNPFRGMFPGRPRKGTAESVEQDMASRLQLDIEGDRGGQKSKESASKVEVFRGVSFEDWLRLFMQYAFLLTKRNEYDSAEEVIRHVMYSNAYQERTIQDTLRLTLITCAVSANRHAVIVEQSRRLINIHQFNNEPHRILAAALASGLRQTDVFIQSTLQKHLLRELKVCASAVKNKDALRWNAQTKRYAVVSSSSSSTSASKGKVEDGEEAGDDEGEGDDQNEGEETPNVGDDRSGSSTWIKLPTSHNPMSVAVYGQICTAAKSYQSAIFYLLHAYDYCPNDPAICLSLAIASLGRAMQRQADNRHHLVAQALAFLTKYRALRTEVDSGRLDEVEYNFGRVFQQLGLHSHAARHYERVLDLAEARQTSGDQDAGIAKEAAYNLSLIYVTTGATHLADALYRRWLSL
ncbi:hypothetical protein JAAARDRAFT_42458 [Jaapia argillacea MUCL 33604]|uniref:TPR-like protein n=1 Tax=Jaapia argillacea MUCL 33604 TaxID=933084 RepID=A0A067PG50_9AGAM|nr:hypothetical protein JAAARDRAFT_42458 [Jaapia argillacea MUCL 33604]